MSDLTSLSPKVNATWQARDDPIFANRTQPQEGDIVSLSPNYLACIGKPNMRRARGMLTMIEHEKCDLVGTVTWDHPGLPDRVKVENLVRARDALMKL